MSFNTKFLISQGRKKLNLKDSSLPNINQKISQLAHTKNEQNPSQFSKDDLQSVIEIYGKDAYDRQIDEKQFVVSKFNKMPFLKKAIRRKGEAFMMSALSQMTLEYYNCGQELYNINQGNKQNFYILLNGQIGIYVQNEQFFLEEKEEELRKEQALKDKSNQQIEQSTSLPPSNNLFKVEVKQMGQAMLKRKAEGYLDKQREKENHHQVPNQSSSIKQQNNDSKIHTNHQGMDYSYKQSSSNKTESKNQGDSSSKKNQKETLTKEKIQELNMIQENLAKKQAREFKELRTIQGLATLGERKTVQSDGGLEVQKMVVKSSQAIVLTMKGETFRQLFSELIESEEKISKIAFFLSIPLFSNFKMREINQILLKTKIQVFKKQQIVYSEGDVAENLYIVKKGEFTIQKEIVLKNPLMPDLYNKKTVKKIEICSLTEGQYFGLNELLEQTLLQNQVVEQQQEDVTEKQESEKVDIVIKRKNAVKSLAAESELFVIPYDSFKKYISPEMINVDSDSLQQQADMRNEILSKKKQQQERQELRMLAMKRNINNECKKYHQRQEEINCNVKEKNQTHYQRFLNDSSSALTLPQLDNQNTIVCQGRMSKQNSFYLQTNAENTIFNKNNSQDCFITKIPTENTQSKRYHNLLKEKYPSRLNKNILDLQNVSQQSDIDFLKDNIQEFNKNISMYNQNMQKYIKAVSEFSEKIHTEPSPFRPSDKSNSKDQRNKYMSTSQDMRTGNNNSGEVRRESKKLMNQLNYMLQNPSQSQQQQQQQRQKRSVTSNSNYQERSISPVTCNPHLSQLNEGNHGLEITPKNQKMIKLQKAGSMEQVNMNLHNQQLNGVKKVDRLFNYLDEIENKKKPHFQPNYSSHQSQIATINNQDYSINNISANYQSLPPPSHSATQHIKPKMNNAKQQLQAISSYQGGIDVSNKTYMEDIDEIENHLNRKDIMVQILNSNNQISNQANSLQKKQMISRLTANNINNANYQSAAQGDSRSNALFQCNYQDLQVNFNQNLAENISNQGKILSVSSNERKNNAPQNNAERSASNNSNLKKQKAQQQQMRQFVSTQSKNLQNQYQNQYEQQQMEQLLEEINENYSKVPIKPFIVSPSCAVKNAKRQIKKSRRNIQYTMIYPVECNSEQQPNEFHLQSHQQQQSQQQQQQRSTSYDYNLNYNTKKRPHSIEEYS